MKTTLKIRENLVEFESADVILINNNINLSVPIKRMCVRVNKGAWYEISNGMTVIEVTDLLSLTETKKQFDALFALIIK